MVDQSTAINKSYTYLEENVTCELNVLDTNDYSQLVLTNIQDESKKQLDQFWDGGPTLFVLLRHFA